MLAAVLAGSAPAGAYVGSPPRVTKSVFLVDLRPAANPVYAIGAYAGGVRDTSFRLPDTSCEQVWPSAISARGMLWVYVAERDCPGTWNRVVLYRGTSLHSLSSVGVVATAAGLHQPTVAYDGERFLLWYTRDSNAGWAHELVFSSSMDGIHFTQPAVKDVAHGWYAAAFNPDYAIRVGALWYLYSVGYGPGLRSAVPGVYVLSDPSAASYPAMQPMLASPRDTPKLDPSIVCVRPNGSWVGVFTPYGDPHPALFGYEWTETYTASSPLGPWHLVAPFIPLGPMLSLENPTPVLSGPGAACNAELAGS